MDKPKTVILKLRWLRPEQIERIKEDNPSIKFRVVK